MIVAGTGHRPNKLGGYEWDVPKRVWVRQQIKQALIDLKATKVISGMALGFDQDLAFMAYTMGLPFIAALPIPDYDSAWPEHARKWCEYLLERAEDVVVVTPGHYAKWKMQARNQWMVDHCNVLLACWDGSDGGTANCVQYAMGGSVFIHRIDPNEFDMEGP